MARDNLPNFALIVAENFGKAVDAGVIQNLARQQTLPTLDGVSLASENVSNIVQNVNPRDTGRGF